MAGLLQAMQVEMRNSKQIAGLIEPTLIAMTISEYEFVQLHPYDTQIPPIGGVRPPVESGPHGVLEQPCSLITPSTRTVKSAVSLHHAPVQTPVLYGLRHVP